MKKGILVIGAIIISFVAGMFVESAYCDKLEKKNENIEKEKNIKDYIKDNENKEYKDRLEYLLANKDKIKINDEDEIEKQCRDFWLYGYIADLHDDFDDEIDNA